MLFRFFICFVMLLTLVQLERAHALVTAPTKLSYRDLRITYLKGKPIQANTPINWGGAVSSYSISPSLPSGLTLNPITGIVSGTPTQIIPETTYTVVAKNSAGSAKAQLVIYIRNNSSLYATNTMPFAADGWRLWKKSSVPVWKGEIFGDYYLASDPTVLHDGNIYRMYYTCLVTALDPADSDGVNSGFCQAKSTDGIRWTFGPSIDPNFKGVALRGGNNTWDTNMETASVIKTSTGIQMYYSGYQTATNGFDGRPPSAIGLATSNNGDIFIRSTNPILRPSNQWYDADDMFSPYAFLFNGLPRLVYAGWCIEGEYANHDGKTCTYGPSTLLVGAAQNTSGAWSKRSTPVQSPTASPTWLTWGAAEPAMLIGPDGYNYLFITGGLGDNEPRVTGIGRSKSINGPWNLSTDPVIKPDGGAGRFDACGSFAPSVMLQGNTVRMWYLGLEDCNGTCTSCDFKACGCEGKFSIGYAETTWPLRSE